MRATDVRYKFGEFSVGGLAPLFYRGVPLREDGGAEFRLDVGSVRAIEDGVGRRDWKGSSVPVGAQCFEESEARLADGWCEIEFSLFC